MALRYASASLHCDREVLLTAVARSGSAFKFADERNLEDIKTAARVMKGRVLMMGRVLFRAAGVLSSIRRLGSCASSHHSTRHCRRRL
mmetsp:Transcript_11228/g.33677  ORF Transcript_11228/g.33677 Transcript_11228/m.33677 type:complete len:88 (-) Transcript_11228:419-682(-)